MSPPLKTSGILFSLQRPGGIPAADLKQIKIIQWLNAEWEEPKPGSQTTFQSRNMRKEFFLPVRLMSAPSPNGGPSPARWPTQKSHSGSHSVFRSKSCFGSHSGSRSESLTGMDCGLDIVNIDWTNGGQIRTSWCEHALSTAT